MSECMLMLVFHAHLPYVRHPEKDYCLEENWLFEAITETYVPLIMILERLQEDGVDYRLCLSLSPTLLSMFADGFLQDRYHRYLSKALELADKEKIRTWGHPHFHQLARFYRAKLHEIQDLYFRRYRGSLISAFRKLQETGKLEIITCTATHGFLPLLQNDPRVVKAQIQVGLETYREFLCRNPDGIWLPECAYYPGLEEVLASYGLKYFFLDGSGITGANPPSPFRVYAPIATPSGVLAFGRDEETSRQVWCAQTGYPGDPLYRDFYRDLGFDLEMSYISPFIDPAGIRTFTGFKYYRVTDKKREKQPYEFQKAFDRARLHARHFLSTLAERCTRLGKEIGRNPLIVSAYDAELLGHWWFEGPVWLEHLIRLVSAQSAIELITPGEYRLRFPQNPEGIPAASSWSGGGFYSNWLNQKNEWIYPLLYTAAARMGEMVERFPFAQGVTRRALNQALRELLLAQSSDWAFIMNNRTSVEYAEYRFREHLANFNRLYEQLTGDGESTGEELGMLVDQLESLCPIFPRLDYRCFS
ncbi:MAG: DUF1957 domain-containing protein [Syntrophomonadaceae bacterium]|nr:DUF1957 domain-containing protein [Syntrophomonadaceae bacterium]